MLTIYVILTVLVLGCLSINNNYKFVGYINGISGVIDRDLLSSFGVPGYSDHGYNVLILSFWLDSIKTGSFTVERWMNIQNYLNDNIKYELTNKINPTGREIRLSIKNIYKQHGILLLISAFGATDHPIRDGVPSWNFVDKHANDTAILLAKFTKDYNFDGIDVDWEESSTMTGHFSLAEDWLIKLTIKLRELLPYNQGYIITHAPQAPYFMGQIKYPRGGYLKVVKDAEHLIDWFNIQFYNQGSSEYNTYWTLYIHSNGWASNTAIKQMIDGANDLLIKVSMHKIVVGKVATEADAFNTGYINKNEFLSILTNAKNTGYAGIGGIMIWQFMSDQLIQFDMINTVKTIFPGITQSGTYSPTININNNIIPSPKPTQIRVATPPPGIFDTNSNPSSNSTSISHHVNVYFILFSLIHIIVVYIL